MTMIRQVMPIQMTPIGENECEVRMSTAMRARDGHVLVPQGGRLDNFRANPVILWNHDTDAPPVGRAENIRTEGDQLVSRVRFAPAGVSARADEIRGLVKAGIISGVSVGFDPIDGQPLDPKKGARGGMRITDWELLECSFCAVPVDPAALVTLRARSGAATETMSQEWRQRQIEILSLQAIPYEISDEQARRIREIDFLELAMTLD